jgi:hypothetical protein
MVKGALGQSAINELNAANLNHAIARSWIKAGGFGIEDDLAH